MVPAGFIQWLNYSAKGGGSVYARRLKGREQRWGSRPPTSGFRAFKGHSGFYGIQVVFDAWILPSRVVDPGKKVPDLNCEVQDLLLEVVDFE